MNIKLDTIKIDVNTINEEIKNIKQPKKAWKKVKLKNC